MNPTAVAETGPTAAPSPWVRLHQVLMPDYNRKATGYWWLVVSLGAVVLVWSVQRVATLPAEALAQVLIGMTIAMVAGFFPVRVPRSKNSFAAGEIFIFLLLLLQGPAAATLAASGEALIGSWRTSRRWTSRIASPAMAALAMFGAGSMLSALLGVLRGAGFTNEGLTIVAAMLFSLAYFVFNTLLVTALPRLKRNERLQITDLVGVFGWIGIAFAGSAAVAALLYLTFRQSGNGVLMAVVPIIVMLLSTLHYYFRQQEAQQAVREAAERALQRESEVAARHLQELEASERRFHSAFTHASIGMALLAMDGRVLQANSAMRALLGRDDGELLQQQFQDFVLDEHLGALAEQLDRVDEDDFDGFELQLRCHHGDGRAVWVAAHFSFFSEPGSAVPCLIVQAQDVSARLEAEAGLHHIAFHDALTGLPNRRRFREHLAQAVEAAQGDARRSFAVMFLDFDRFKLINDSLGHNAGDEFLVQVALRIQANVRPKDVVARLGGDEFAVLVLELAHEQQVTALADRMLQVLRDPYFIAGTELSSSASIGITFSGFGYATPEEVLRDADIAMYKAKAAGKARYALFDVSLHAEAARRLSLEGDLRRAIREGQVELAYQPLYNLESGALCGFEALARWEHAEHGPISPDTFIPIAEETGLIVPLTDLLLQRACAQLKVWQDKDPDFAEMTMHVNISGRDLGQSGLVARVMHALLAAHLQPRFLTLELTENILMERLESALPTLADLRQLGIGLSVDDFGTGYSSLAHLSSLPIDSFKVDRSFVSELRSGSQEATIVRAIVHLGGSLGKRVIAEGIETPSQLSQLREMGCQMGQGYHMSRPLPADAVGQLLEQVLKCPTQRLVAPVQAASALLH